MKKTFKWILFSTLILSIGAIIAMMAIYLPQYTKWANYSTKDGYNTFICYDDVFVEKDESALVKYTLNATLYNLSDKDQTLTFRFWFTCTDSEGDYADYIDKEITISANPTTINDYSRGCTNYSCELPYFNDCLDVKFGASVSPNDLNIDWVNDMGDKESTISVGIYDVLINKEGIRVVDGLEITRKDDYCESLDSLISLTRSIDSMWQGAFTGVIIALSCTGGIFVLCLIFTIILLLPNKKKKFEGQSNER
ncbi:MAG: hypothetical protein E7345_05525 [Clostridiales bacterium]|nr:hypothetical protein [Clostridiales bacterium]